MRLNPRIAVVGGLLSLMLLAFYLVTWLNVNPLEIRRSDFTSTYMGGQLWRQGHHGDLYDESLQAKTHAQIIVPDREGNLPFVNPPIAAVVAAPITWLSLDSSYRLWNALQLILFLCSLFIAVKYAPWPKGTRAITKVLLALFAFAGISTLNLFLLGQWDGLSALGLSITYVAWRKGNYVQSGFWFAIIGLIGKPHILIGIVAFLLGLRNRKIWLGLLSGLLVMTLVSFMAVGFGGLVGFVQQDLHSTSRWTLVSFLGFSGLFGSWLGNSTTSYVLMFIFGTAAYLGCLKLGDLTRKQINSWELSFSSAVALSLIATPHLLGQDLVVLAPVFIWMTASFIRPNHSLIIWGIFNLAALLDFGNLHPAPPGRLVPFALVAFAIAAGTEAGIHSENRKN